jgi:hypothetical protein
MGWRSRRGCGRQEEEEKEKEKALQAKSGNLFRKQAVLLEAMLPEYIGDIEVLRAERGGLLPSGWRLPGRSAGLLRPGIQSSLLYDRRVPGLLLRQ